MKMICAWCLKDLGDKHPEQPGISHGICASCAKKILEEKDGNYPIVGNEYQKGPRFQSIYCGECIKDRPLDWDFVMDISAAEAEEEELTCDICGKELKK